MDPGGGGRGGGLAFWALVEAATRGAVADERLLLVLGAALATGFGGMLAMAGPMGPAGAALRAGPLAVLVAGLIWLTLRRWPAEGAVDGFLAEPMPSLAVMAVAVLPIPFLLAQAGPGRSWRDYGALFDHSWGIAVRGAVAVAFTAVVWAVIFLSDQLLQVVGVTLIGDVLSREVVPFLITGGVFGLAVAVVNEVVGGTGPRMVLWLLRLLLPVVAVVSAVFAVSLILWGFARTPQWVSPALTLLAMAAAGITGVTVVLDAGEAEASRSPVLGWAARGMALLVPVLAGLGLWALAARVGDYGWTPERLFLALLLALAAVYGAAYAAAVGRGRGWEARIRAVNPPLALGVLAAAVLWLTPVLDAERIAARDQLARYEAGRMAPEALDPLAIGRWGLAGEAALAGIRAAAEARGDTVALARLDDPGAVAEMPEADLAALRAEVAAAMALRPESATGTRDMFLLLMQEWELEALRDSCRAGAPGQPGCLMVVADLLPGLPGEEAVLATGLATDWPVLEGLYPNPEGWLMRAAMRTAAGYPTSEEVRALAEAWLAAPPPLSQAPVMQLGTGDTGVFFLP